MTGSASEGIRRLRAMLRTGATEQKVCDVNGVIVEAHGGTIRAERNTDQGLCVRVELPCGAGP